MKGHANNPSIPFAHTELKKMYGNQTTEKFLGTAVCDRYENLTVGQNLDAKIANMRKELAALEHSKLTLGPLLDMRINDLRQAMNY